MNAFNDQNIVFIEFEISALIHPFSGLEIKLRHLNRLAVEKVKHIVHEEIDIKGLKDFIVVISVNIDRCLLPVDKIVIHADDMRP